MASKISKIKKAATNYAKNVAGGASIVAKAVLGSAGTSTKQTGIAPVNKTPTPVLNAPLLPGLGINNKGQVVKKGGNTSKTGNALSPGQFGGSTNPAQTFTNTKTTTQKKSSGGGSSKSSFQSPTINTSSSDFSGLSSSSRSFDSVSSPTAGTAINSSAPSIATTSVVNNPNVTSKNFMDGYPEETFPNYASAIPTPRELVEKKIDDQQENFMKDLMKLNEQRETPAEIDQRLQKELGIKQKQQEVTNLTGQLNAIVNKGQAQQLSIIGQGRGIPEAIIGGQQAQIGRETAIAALPVQAQLEAAQGNLEMANDSLDRLFKLYSEEADRQFQFKKEVRTFAYEFATAKQKRQLDELDKQEEIEKENFNNLNDERNTYAKMAFANNQSTLGAKIAGLDYKDKNFLKDLNKLISQLQEKTKSSGGSANFTKTEQKNYEAFKSEIYSYPNSVDALNDLRANRVAIVQKIGEPGYKLLERDIRGHFGTSNKGTKVGNNFYADLGGADSAFPSTPDLETEITDFLFN